MDECSASSREITRCISESEMDIDVVYADVAALFRRRDVLANKD